MPDVLIRNFPPTTSPCSMEQAARMGISRTEYLRRHLHREARRTAGSGDRRRPSLSVAELLPDLADDTIMSDAWS